MSVAPGSSRRELIPIPGGGLLMDTPGLRELRFLAKRRYWAKMKKHHPRPPGSDSGEDE